MQIQTPGPGRRLQFGLNLEGGPPTPTVNPDLQPVVLVADFTRLDFQSPDYERPCIYDGYVAAAGATHVGYSYLCNPTGSGVLANLHAVQSWSTAAANRHHYMAMWQHSVGGGGSRFRDTRFQTAATNVPSCKVHDTDFISGAPPSWVILGRMDVVYNGGGIIDWCPFGPWLLAPGWSLAVYSGTANEDIISMWSWTERLLNAQEK
jgi:hypothetical protein